MCGSRLAKGGAREWSGEAPQMSCYGKIVSGLGVPLSMVAGESRFLDTVRTDGLFADYAGRKGWTQAEAERWLSPNLGYRTDDE